MARSHYNVLAAFCQNVFTNTRLLPVVVGDYEPVVPVLKEMYAFFVHPVINYPALQYLATKKR